MKNIERFNWVVCAAIGLVMIVVFFGIYQKVEALTCSVPGYAETATCQAFSIYDRSAPYRCGSGCDASPTNRCSDVCSGYGKFGSCVSGTSVCWSAGGYGSCTYSSQTCAANGWSGAVSCSGGLAYQNYQTAYCTGGGTTGSCGYSYPSTRNPAYDYTCDVTPPTASISPGTAGGTYTTTSNPLSYTATWADTGSGLATCMIYIDAGWYTIPCSGASKTYVGSLALGSHSLILYAADRVGRTAYSSWYYYNITNPVPTASITANNIAVSTTIAYNTAATIRWTSTNATSCTGTNFSTGGATNNSTGVSTGTLYATKTYSISCTGPGGTANRNVVVHVLPVYSSCSANSCVLNTGIEGQTYSNLCSNNTMTAASCGGGGGGGGGGGSWHSVCANNQCVVVNGAGTNQCSTALNCAGSYPAQYYGVCAQGTCVMVSGTDVYATSRGVSSCSNYGGTCPNPVGSSYNISSSNDLRLSITKQTGTVTSNNTTLIIVEPLSGFSDTVNLSVNNWGGLASYSPTANFSRTSLTSAQYSTGATLSVSVPVTVPSNNYSIVVRGTGATSGKVIDRTVNVALHNAASSTWQER